MASSRASWAQRSTQFVNRVALVRPVRGTHYFLAQSQEIHTELIAIHPGQFTTAKCETCCREQKEEFF